MPSSKVNLLIYEIVLEINLNFPKKIFKDDVSAAHISTYIYCSYVCLTLDDHNKVASAL